MAQEQKRIMTAEERDRMSASIEEDESFKKAAETGILQPGVKGPISEIGDKHIDMRAFEGSINHRKRILAEGTPEPLTGVERMRAEKRAKELKDILADRLLTHRENNLLPRDAYQYQRAVRKSIRFEVGNEETQRFVREYQDIACRLFPDDPEAQSVDSLRKDS